MYDKTFKTNIEIKLKSVGETDFTLSNNTFFCEKHIRDAMNQINKKFSPRPDRMTPEVILNGEKNLVAALNILMQASYQLGYFPKPWKKRKQNLSKETREK